MFNWFYRAQILNILFQSIKYFTRGANHLEFLSKSFQGLLKILEDLIKILARFLESLLRSPLAISDQWQYFFVFMCNRASSSSQRHIFTMCSLFVYKSIDIPMDLYVNDSPTTSPYRTKCKKFNNLINSSCSMLSQMLRFKCQRSASAFQL